MVSRHVVVGLALALVACGPARDRAPEPSATLPQSVVLFAPSMTEAACALGFADRIVAITDYDRWPPEILDRPRIGGALDPDLERLAVLQPDLLVLQGENDRLRQFAIDSGLRIADVKMDDDLESILQGILRLDDLLGGEQSDAGESLTLRIRMGLDSVAGSVPTEPVTALLVLSRSPHSLGGVFTAGRGTFLDDLLGVAGGVNWAAEQGAGYFEVPLDLIAADPPDLVLEYTAGIEGDPEERARVWASLPGPPLTVEPVEFDGLMIPGPRLVRSARSLAEAMAAAR